MAVEINFNITNDPWINNGILLFAEKLISLKDSSDFVDDVEQYTTYVSAHRQKLTAPLYTKIEYLILLKSIKVVKSIGEDDIKAPTMLKALAGTLESLLKHNDILAPTKTDIFEATIKQLDKMHSESDDALNAKINELAKQIKTYES